MKIELDVPEWGRERRIYVLLGHEAFAVRDRQEGWFVKTERCNKCGKCCEADENWPLGTKVLDDGRRVCSYLNKSGEEWACGAGGIAPFSCCRDNPFQLAHEECSIRYRRL